MRFRAPVVAAFLCSVFTLPAIALPGEAAAVIRSCGQPQAQEQAMSPVTEHLQYNLTYGDTILHFQPMEGGWSFTTAWHNHLPMTRSELEAQMPCFRTAMDQAAKVPLPFEDPTIAQQSAVGLLDASSFGIQFLWLIVVLVVILAIALLIPSARRRQVRTAAHDLLLKSRRFRKPSLAYVEPIRRHPLTEIEPLPPRVSGLK
jgi:hypothetical protein